MSAAGENLAENKQAAVVRAKAHHERPTGYALHDGHKEANTALGGVRPVIRSALHNHTWYQSLTRACQCRGGVKAGDSSAGKGTHQQVSRQYSDAI
jgi:hypothetical protein